MGFDFCAETLRVLEHGLPPLPDRFESGPTTPIAVWRGQRHGAVLFVRRWRNGDADSECVVTTRADDGSWDAPSSSGGGPWIDDPLVRQATGWDGDPVVLLGERGCGSVEAADPIDEDDSDEWGGLTVRVLLGAASALVAAIEVKHAGRTWRMPIESPCGAFAIGLEPAGAATLRALGHNERPLALADGATALVV